MKPTGAVQVIARDGGERVRLPVSDAIIVPLDSKIIYRQHAMVGDISQSQLQARSMNGGGVPRHSSRYKHNFLFLHIGKVLLAYLWGMAPS